MFLKVYDKRIEYSYRNLRCIEKDGWRFTKSRGHIQRRRNPYQRDYSVLFGIVEIHVSQNPSNCILTSMHLALLYLAEGTGVQKCRQ